MCPAVEYLSYIKLYLFLACFAVSFPAIAMVAFRDEIDASYFAVYAYLHENEIDYGDYMEIRSASEAYYDTVNISNSIQFENGSYLFQNILISNSLVKVYDFEMLAYDEIVPVRQHKRARICTYSDDMEKICVKLCCGLRQIKVPNARTCSNMSADIKYSPFLNVSYRHGASTINILNETIIQQGIPCAEGVSLLANDWQLQANGDLIRLTDNMQFLKSEYCLTPSKSDATEIYTLNPMVCVQPFNEDFYMTLVQGIDKFITVPLLAAALLIYLCITRVRSLHSKCLLCYLISLTLTKIPLTIFFYDARRFYFSLVGIALQKFIKEVPYFWLNVLCFELWRNICYNASKSQTKVKQLKCFWLYVLYVYGAAFLSTIIEDLLFSYYVNGINTKLPVLHKKKYCLLQWRYLLAVYFAGGQIFLIVPINTILLTLAYKKIIRSKKEMQMLALKADFRRHMRNQEDNVLLFLRIFIVMSVTWLCENVYVIIDCHSKWKIYRFIPTITNVAQSFIILMLLITRRSFTSKVKQKFSLLKFKQYEEL